MIIVIPIIPANKVFCKEFSPKAAVTILDESSFNLVGKDPELINSTYVETSSLVKLPVIWTSLEKAWDTDAADKQLEFSKSPQLYVVAKLSISSSKSNQITIRLSG